MTRETAVNNIFDIIENTSEKSYVRKKSNRKYEFKDIFSIISLFGISAEELSEAGVSYESLKALESALN